MPYGLPYGLVLIKLDFVGEQFSAEFYHPNQGYRKTKSVALFQAYHMFVLNLEKKKQKRQEIYMLIRYPVISPPVTSPQPKVTSPHTEVTSLHVRN